MRQYYINFQFLIIREIGGTVTCYRPVSLVCVTLLDWFGLVKTSVELANCWANRLFLFFSIPPDACKDV